MQHSLFTGTLRLAAVLAALLLMCACAGVTKPSQGSAHLNQTAYQERFKATRSQCNAQGGRMVIAASQRLDRDGVPARGDYYFCSRSS